MLIEPTDAEIEAAFADIKSLAHDLHCVLEARGYPFKISLMALARTVAQGVTGVSDTAEAREEHRKMFETGLAIYFEMFRRYEDPEAHLQRSIQKEIAHDTERRARAARRRNPL